MASFTNTPLTPNEWNEEKCIKLIREYRARPVLWDTKSPLFFKKHIKSQAWKDIGNILNIPADDCKHKMIVLLSSFRREKARIMHSILDKKSDATKIYTSMWFGFNEMAFLMDKDSERKRLYRSTHDDDDDDEAPRRKKNSIIIHNKTPRRDLLRVPSSRDENIVNRSQPSSAPSTSVIQQKRLEKPTDFDEEIKSFATFIANKMKKYSETTKNAVQQAICEVIFKADQGFYENYTSYENYCYTTPSKGVSDTNQDTDPLNREQHDLRIHENVIAIKQLIESDDSE